MMIDNNRQTFLMLLRAGLWETDINLSISPSVCFADIYRLAEEQSVVGLVAAGIEHIKESRIRLEDSILFVESALQMECRNNAMNDFIAKLVKKFEEYGIVALLVKGQGIAQCYERPLWRMAGDIDLLFNVKDYSKAISIVKPFATRMDHEMKERLHQGMQIQNWDVEIHGSLRNFLWKRVNMLIDETQNETFSSLAVRKWSYNDNTILLPEANNDVIFVFTHILQHFYREGVGLRQICDWCRLIWKYKDDIDNSLLNQRLRTAGILSEWKAFSAYAIDYLGMPKEAMPLYSNEKKWKRKAARINSYVFKVGNFGHNRDDSYYYHYPFLVRKSISLWRRTTDWFQQIFIFPLDSTIVWIGTMRMGAMSAIRGEG